MAEGKKARDGVDELHPDSPTGFREREETHDTNSITPKAFASTNDSARNTLGQPASSVPFDSRTADTEKSLPGEDKEALSEIITMKGKSTDVYSDTTSQQLLLNPGDEIINANAGNSAVKQQKDTTTFSQVIDGQKGFAKTDSLQEKPAEDKQKMKFSSRLSLGILFAPEFSTTRLNHYSSPGSSLGLRIGYQVSRKFSLNTGIIRSSKKYKDEASEYNTNPGYWKYRTNGVVPSEIYGECLVLEVPLDIQFDAIHTENSRVFASAGISSYFMLSQSYDYHFETPNPGADNGWSTSESESYWFGVGTISAGYERKIHPALMIGIEPYLKIALTEIGWPNINLLSTGAYVTLRYKFIKRRN